MFIEFAASACVRCFSCVLSAAAWVQVSRTFTADAKMVKKRLEDLIDREYLTRDENNANMYRYVA